MTHDKAVELAHHAMVNSKSRAHGLVDALVVLGLLDHLAGREEKLGAVANARVRMQMLLQDDVGLGPYYIDQLFAAIDKANLELVERK